MRTSLILGADIRGRRATVRMDGGIDVPLTFPARIRRVTTYDYGHGMLVETVDGKIRRYTADELLGRAKATA